MKNKAGWFVVYAVAVVTFPGLYFTGQLIAVKLLATLGVL